jgi:hypothetical protein
MNRHLAWFATTLLVSIIVLLPDSVWAKEELTGRWGLQDGTRMVISQQRDSITAKIDYPSRANKKLGYTRGMIVVKGKLTGNKLVGELRIQMQGEHIKRCPKNQFHWTELKLKHSSDGRSLSGTYQKKHYDNNCKKQPAAGKYRIVFYRMDRPPVLPASGTIKVRGRSKKRKGPVDGAADCSCDTIMLARVTTKIVNGKEAFLSKDRQVKKRLTYSVKRHYELDRSTNPPVAKPFSIPWMQVNELNQLCFYFTFPRGHAFTAQQGATHSCRTQVKIKFPHSRARTGYLAEEWQLFSVRGLPGYQTHNDNSICRVVAKKGNSITAGKGAVSIRVKGKHCKGQNFLIN